MEKDFKFAVEDIQRINLSEYEDDEFAVAKMGYLSTKPNSHGLKISEKVLRESASTVLNKWLVADMTGIVDAGTHTKEEKIVGRIPKEQDVEFVYDDDGYLRAYVDVVISKIYAKDFCKIFEEENNRAVSVEMRVLSNEDDESIVESFKIVGVTTLGKQIRPSCPDSDIEFTRFSEEEADKFFAKVHNNSLTALKKFVEERKESMAEQEKLVSHPIDTSKEAMYDGEWDGQKAKQDLVKEKNFKTLAPKVCMKLEPGWEDHEVTKLGYPVMMLHSGKWVYSTKGLASALGYAKKEDETEVINKVEKIYKKLGLDSDRKEDDAKMAEIEFAAVDIGDMWGKMWDALHARYPDGDWGSVYRIDGIYEEDNKKFAVIHHKDEDTKYRLDFSLTEEGLTLADEIVKVELEIIETDEVKKFAEPENAEKYTKFEIEGRKAWAKVIKKVQDHEGDSAYVDSIEDDHIIYTKDDVRYRVEADVKVDKDDKSVDADIKWGTVKKDKNQKMAEMTPEEMAEKIGELQKNIEDRDNIIMEKDKKMGEMEAELSELREYKAACEKKELATSVESIMAEVKDCMAEDKYNEFRNEGLTCKMSELDAWAKKVKAFCFENGKVPKNSKKHGDVFSFAAPAENNQKPMNVWDRLKNL